METTLTLTIIFLILCILWLHQKTFGQVSKTNDKLVEQNEMFFNRNLLLQDRLHDATSVKEMLREIMQAEKGR